MVPKIMRGSARFAYGKIRIKVATVPWVFTLSPTSKCLELFLRLENNSCIHGREGLLEQKPDETEGLVEEVALSGEVHRYTGCLGGSDNFWVSN